MSILSNPSTLQRFTLLLLMALGGSSRSLQADPAEATITAPSGAVTVATQQAVAFTASSTDSSGRDGFSVTGFSWSFGDGATGVGASATHAYAAPGSYTATLTVSYTVRTCKRMDYAGNCTSWITTNLTATATRTVTVTSASISAVSPANPTVDAGSTVPFSATVSGAATPGVTWSVSGGGSIGSNGVFTASTAGTFTVTATSVADPSKSSSTSVTVRSIVTGIVLTPSSISLRAGENTAFSAQIQGQGGPTTAVTWSASGGSIASSGAYTAPLAGGAYTVTATSVQDPTKKATATVSVASISVGVPAPSNGTVDAGNSIQFSATVNDAANPAVTWSVNGGGSISGGGLFTATLAGTYTVTATSVADPSKSASTTVGVRSVVTGVTLTPSTTNLKAGEAIMVTAQVLGLGGPATGVTWTATGGTVAGNGLYTAPLVGGQYTLTARSIQDPTKMASMTVMVSPVVVSALTPGGAVVDAGSSIQFSATAEGAADPSVRWSVSGGGSISASGLFSATTAGSYAVTATSQANPGQSASTSVTVKSVVSGMTLTAPKTALSAGETIRLSAGVSEVGGGDTTVTWAATAGSIASGGDGTYVAPVPATPLTVQVTATSVQNPAVVRTISLSVSAAAVAPVVPANPIVEAGRSVAFSTAVTGAADPGVTWSVDGGGSISASGVFTAALAGTYTVTATSVADPGRTARTSVTVRAVVSGVSVTPASATLTAGQALRFSAVVSGLGIVQGGVTWAASSGSMAADGTFTAPAQPGPVTITATSLQDPSKSGTASLTVRGWVLKWKKDIVYVGTKEIGEVDAQGLHVTLVDHLGSPRFLVNGAGMVESEQKFLPFGESLTDPATASTFGKGFTNHEQTDPSGLIYMQARFYAPMYGRFLSPDPARDQHFEETQSWNLYSYVQNNPTMKIDPTGMVGEEIPLITSLITWYFSRSSAPTGSLARPIAFPVASYKTGGRAFGSPRDGGRTHAGADLLAKKGSTEAVYAVKGGVVASYAKPFYSGTYAVEVKNTDGTVLRYGEIGPNLTGGLKPGSPIAPGQQLGNLQPNNKDGNSMLHLEEYKGTETGPLTQKDNGSTSQRRSDLKDVTPLLDKVYAKPKEKQKDK